MPAVLDAQPDVGRRPATPARDVLVALAVVVGLWWTVEPATGRVVQGGLALVAVAAVAMRHRFPLTATVAAVVATAVAWVLGVSADPCLLVGMCLFTVAERRGGAQFPRWSVAAAVVTAASLLTVAPQGLAENIRWLVVAVVVVTASWALGVRTRQVRIEAAARSAAQERLRLARDVHDVLSHSLGVIGVRAGVTAHVGGLPSEELRGTLREIETEARSALGELGGLLDRARRGGWSGRCDDLAGALATMAGELRSCGIVVDADICGTTGAWPPALRTAVEQIAREATTNVIRHSGARRCRITLREAGQQVVLGIVDDGRGIGGRVAGHGITGMRERAALAGGTVDVGEGPGCAVTARLPMVPGRP
ncbi:histidine kinase [Pseudonocardia sp. NPDC049635]|uniref:sensor histidine kinase n=1 Tax=Pseudonocardia sp. NPDC049635 TaxID=3155506 RepID=UPI0033D50B65